MGAARGSASSDHSGTTFGLTAMDVLEALPEDHELQERGESGLLKPPEPRPLALVDPYAHDPDHQKVSRAAPAACTAACCVLLHERMHP